MPLNPTEPQSLPPEPRSSIAPFVRSGLGLLTLGLIALAASLLVFAYLEALPTTASQTAGAATSSDVFDGMLLIADSAIVIDLSTGTILYEKNADARLPLASLTKVPLALAVSEVLSPDRIITIPYDTGYTEGGQRLLKGERWKVRDVLHFTLIASSNEGAEILAQAAEPELRALYASSTPGSAALWRMNDLARSLGLTDTRFLNVSGLDIDTARSGAYGSARDMARIFAYAATARPEIFAGTTKDGLLLVDETGDTTAAFNTNDALGGIPGLIMGKTGFTDLAGGNLAVVFDVGLSQPVVAVVLSSTRDGRFSDMQQLVDRARAAITRQ